MNGTIEIVGAGSKPAPTIQQFQQKWWPIRPAPTILPCPLGLTPGEREAVYEAVVNLVRAAREGTERVAMGYEWNNQNCRGGFQTRPYHPPQLQQELSPIQIRPYHPTIATGMVAPATRPYHHHWG